MACQSSVSERILINSVVQKDPASTLHPLMNTLWCAFCSPVKIVQSNHYERRSALEQVTIVYEKLLSYKLSYFKLAGDKFVKRLKEISGKICHNVMMLTIIHRRGLFSIEHV